MQVGLVIYGDLDNLSGGYLYDRLMVETLREAGDQVEIISLSWRDYLRHLGDNLSSAIFKRLSNLRVDVLLQDELNHPSLAWMNYRLRRVIDYPIVSIIHHLRCSELRAAWANHFYRNVEKRYLKSVDGLILNSLTTQRVVAQVGVDLQTRPHVIAYPAGDRFHTHIQDSDIVQRATSPGPLRLLFLANLIPRKGLHILLEAISQLPEHTCSLTVVGSAAVDPAYARLIQDQMDRLHLEKRVQLCGQLDDERLVELMRRSHVLVLPSTYEGFGIAYLEGMGFGLPSIATTSGAAWELITHGENGYLIPPEDATVLASYINELASDRVRLSQLSLAARQRFLAHPTWAQSAGKIRAFLRELVGSDVSANLLDKEIHS